MCQLKTQTFCAVDRNNENPFSDMEMIGTARERNRGHLNIYISNSSSEKIYPPNE